MAVPNGGVLPPCHQGSRISSSHDLGIRQSDVGNCRRLDHTEQANQKLLWPVDEQAVDGETAAVVRKNENFADRLMFWQPGTVIPSADSQTPIDPEDERRRIEQVTGGGEVIIVQPRRSGRKLPGL